MRKNFIDHTVVNESFDLINFIIKYVSAQGKELISLSIGLALNSKDLNLFIMSVITTTTINYFDEKSIICYYSAY